MQDAEARSGRAPLVEPKRPTSWRGASACSCVAALASACAQTRPVFTLDVPLASRYMFRGAVNDDDPVIQPSLSVDQELQTGALSASLWSNFELGDDRGLAAEFTEVDVSLGYSLSLEQLDVSVGAASYQYPHTGSAGSLELYTLVSLSELALTPTLELWYDIDEAQGAYLNLNFSREVELGAEWSLWAVAGVGWMDSGQGDYNFGVSSPGLSDLQAQAVATRPLSESVSFSAIAAWSSVLDAAYRDAVADPDNLVFAVGIALAF